MQRHIPRSASALTICLLHDAASCDARDRKALNVRGWWQGRPANTLRGAGCIARGRTRVRERQRGWEPTTMAGAPQATHTRANKPEPATRLAGCQQATAIQWRRVLLCFCPVPSACVRPNPVRAIYISLMMRQAAFSATTPLQLLPIAYKPHASATQKNQKRFLLRRE